MKTLKNGLLLFLLVLSLFVIRPAIAQTSGSEADETTMVEANAANTEVEMADQLRRDGKIYIVVGCLLVVLAGMVFYLISIDRKVAQLEKQHKS
jgi:hypothetical protein